MLRRIMAVGAVLAAFALGSAYAQETVSGDTDLVRGTDSGINSVRDDDDGFDMGWIGLLGLAGLAGLMPRDRRDRNDNTGTGHTTKR